MKKRRKKYDISICIKNPVTIARDAKGLVHPEKKADEIGETVNKNTSTSKAMNTRWGDGRLQGATSLTIPPG